MTTQLNSPPAKHRPPLDEALAAAALGLKVFPLQPSKGKWEFKTGHRLDRSHATTNETTIRAWFNEGLAYGVGALMPPGIVCVDVDKERLGKFTYETTQTYTDRTPDDGLHIFYRLPEGMQCKSHIDRPECEIFGTAGKTTMAGSVGEKGEYVTIDDSPIAPAPEWLLQIIATEGQPALFKPAESVQKVGNGLTPYGEAALLGETAKVRNTPEGNRSRTLNNAALKLGGLIQAGHLTAAVIEAHLTAATAGWSDSKKIAATIKKGIADGEKRPRNVTPLETRQTTRAAIAEMQELAATAFSKGKVDTGIETEKHNYTKAQALTVRAGILAVLDRANQANTLDLHLSQRDLAQVAHMGKQTAWKVLHALKTANMLEAVKQATAEQGTTYRLTFKGFLALQKIPNSESSTGLLRKKVDDPSSSVGKEDDSLLANSEPRTTGIFKHGELGRAGELVLKVLESGPCKVSQIVAVTGLADSTTRRAITRLEAAGMIEQEGRIFAVIGNINPAIYAYLAKSNIPVKAAEKASRHTAERIQWQDKVKARREATEARRVPQRIEMPPELSSTRRQLQELGRSKSAPKLQSQVDDEQYAEYCKAVGLK